MRLEVMGYTCFRPGEPAEALTQIAYDMQRFAEREGLVLADISTEHVDTHTRCLTYRPAFCALLEALQNPEVYGVLIPSIGHLSAAPGTGKAMRTTIVAETGARVFIMCSSEAAGR